MDVGADGPDPANCPPAPGRAAPVWRPSPGSMQVDPDLLPGAFPVDLDGRSWGGPPVPLPPHRLREERLRVDRQRQREPHTQAAQAQLKPAP